MARKNEIISDFMGVSDDYVKSLDKMEPVLKKIGYELEICPLNGWFCQLIGKEGDDGFHKTYTETADTLLEAIVAVASKAISDIG